MNEYSAILLMALLSAGCASKPQCTSRTLSEQEFFESRNPWQDYSVRELGIGVRAPSNPAYMNWSPDLFTLLLHPLVNRPVADASYGIAIQFTRIPVDQAGRLVSDVHGESLHDWTAALHKKLAVRTQGTLTYVRRDIVRTGGEVLSMRGVVRASPLYKQDVDWTKRILDSVEPLAKMPSP